MTRNLVRVTESLAHIKAAAGKLIHLDLEPEPDGLLSASREVADFFRDWLLQLGAPVLAAKLGMSVWEAHQCLLEHIRVCLDTCHLAVEYEDPAAALNTLAAAGVRVGKVQITAGLKVELPAEAGCGRPWPGTWRPSPIPLTSTRSSARPGMAAGSNFPTWPRPCRISTPGLGRNCRIHYHMPLFVDRYRHLASTRDDTRAVLGLLKDRGFARHLEIETYTWEWLPPDLKLRPAGLPPPGVSLGAGGNGIRCITNRGVGAGFKPALPHLSRLEQCEGGVAPTCAATTENPAAPGTAPPRRSRRNGRRPR